MSVALRGHSFYLFEQMLPKHDHLKCIKRTNCYLNYGQRILASRENYVKLIQEFTVVSRNHMTPEIQLHLIIPNTKLWSANENQCPFQDPFWAFYWPGGQALSRYILDNPSLVMKKTVLDVGCGSGACSIAANLSNATVTIANDIDEVACIAAVLNAELNGVELKIDSNNIIGEDVACDCILVGDLCYDEEFCVSLLTWLYEMYLKGKTILIGDAERLKALRVEGSQRLKLLTSYQLPYHVSDENDGISRAEIWSF